MTKRSIDVNCDMGEGFGAYRFGSDRELLRWVSSANIACGMHAGDPLEMRATVAACVEAGVAIGAHPGLPDLQGFGRRTMALTPDEIYAVVLYQIGALSAFVQAAGASLRHVKPHGALYHMAEADAAISRAIVNAAADYDRRLVLFGLSGGVLIRTAEDAGLAVKREAFADRVYLPNGALTPRRESKATIEDSAEAARQALSIVRDGVALTAAGEKAPVQADTICIHGDGPHAAEHARAIHTALAQQGVRISHDV